MVRGIQDEYDRAVAIGKLTAHLPEIVSEALESASEIKYESTRVIALLRGLASHLPEMPEILSEALKLVRGIQKESSQAFALRELVPYLPEQLLSKALEIVRDIKSEDDRASALRVLAPYLPEPLLPKVLEMAQGMQNESSRATALRWSAPHLPKQLVSKALEIAQGIQNESSQTDVLSWLAPHLPEKLLSEVLERVPSIDEHCRADVLNRLVPHLSVQLLSRAYEVAEGILTPPEGVPALISLTPYPSDSLFSKALEVVRSRGINQATALSRLALHLPKQFLPEALEIARGIQNESSRASALGALSQHFPEILPEALEAARRIRSNYDQASALGALSQHFPEILSEALEASRRIQSNYDQASVFSQFASRPDLNSFDFPLCSEMLHTLSYQERRRFLGDLPNLAPAVIALSDRSVVKFMVQAIREVCQQWP